MYLVGDVAEANGEQRHPVPIDRVEIFERRRQAEEVVRPERGSIFGQFSAHADGQR